MYVFFWGRRQTAWLAAVLMLAVILGLSVQGYRQTMTATAIGVPSPVYRGDPARKEMALTFNVDWGGEFLPGLLQALDNGQARATFFITGRWAAANPQLVGQIAERGHEVGNHGYSHPHADQLSRSANQEEIRRAEKVLSESSGQAVRLFAPPYGESGPQVLQAAQELGYRTIMWTVDTVDWQQGKRAEDIRAKVSRQAQNGAIVLMHPTAATVQALPGMIKDLREAGYDMVTVSQLLQSPGQ